MNTDTQSKPLVNALSEAAKEAAQRATVMAKDLSGTSADAAKDVQNTAKDIYRTVSDKVDEGMAKTREYAQQATDATKDAAQRAGVMAKDLGHTISDKAEVTLVRSKEYARENPASVVLGAFVLGIAIGCWIVTARREPTLHERYTDALDSWSHQLGRAGNNLKFW